MRFTAATLDAAWSRDMLPTGNCFFDAAQFGSVRLGGRGSCFSPADSPDLEQKGMQTRGGYARGCSRRVGMQDAGVKKVCTDETERDRTAGWPHISTSAPVHEGWGNCGSIVRLCAVCMRVEPVALLHTVPCTFQLRVLCIVSLCLEDGPFEPPSVGWSGLMKLTYWGAVQRLFRDGWHLTWGCSQTPRSGVAQR